MAAALGRFLGSTFLAPTEIAVILAAALGIGSALLGLWVYKKLSVRKKALVLQAPW